VDVLARPLEHAGSRRLLDEIQPCLQIVETVFAGRIGRLRTDWRIVAPADTPVEQTIAAVAIQMHHDAGQGRIVRRQPVVRQVDESDSGDRGQRVGC